MHVIKYNEPQGTLDSCLRGNDGGHLLMLCHNHAPCGFPSRQRHALLMRGGYDGFSLWKREVFRRDFSGRAEAKSRHGAVASMGAVARFFSYLVGALFCLLVRCY